MDQINQQRKQFFQNHSHLWDAMALVKLICLVSWIMYQLTRGLGDKRTEHWKEFCSFKYIPLKHFEYKWWVWREEIAVHSEQIVLCLLNGNKSGGMDVPDYWEDPGLIAPQYQGQWSKSRKYFTHWPNFLRFGINFQPQQIGIGSEGKINSIQYCSKSSPNHPDRNENTPPSSHIQEIVGNCSLSSPPP